MPNSSTSLFRLVLSLVSVLALADQSAAQTTRRVLFETFGNIPGTVVMSPDGRFVATHKQPGAGFPSSTFSLSDTQTNEIFAVPGVQVLSADGRYVAYSEFQSTIFNRPHTYVYDRQTGALEDVAVATDGTLEGSSFSAPAITRSGRLVAFVSGSANIVPGRTGGLFLRDRVARSTTWLSDVTVVPAAFSADDRWLVCMGSGQVLVIDVGTGQTTKIGEGVFPAISANGRYVAFTSFATNLVEGDTNGKGDVFRFDRQTGQMIRVSVANDGAQGNDASAAHTAAISADGRHVAFHSEATNLVSGDTNGVRDAFVRDIIAATTIRVSVGKGGVPGNGPSDFPAISDDGRFVAFASQAYNLAPGDVNEAIDVFLYDAQGTPPCTLPNAPEPRMRAVPASAGTGSFTIKTAGTSCPTTATSTATWLTITDVATSAGGDVTIGYSYSANTSQQYYYRRSAAILIGEQAFGLRQAGLGTGGRPVGTVDTPRDGDAGLTGSIAVTGWAYDTVFVTRVRILRDPVVGEPAGALVFIGNAVQVPGARPDAQPPGPQSALDAPAGWGYLLLTNGLPGGGNGTYVLYAYADNVEGNTALLRKLTITCDNAHATKPFGSIDTPGQGETIAGASYTNFGWAMTPQPKTIPRDGSTIIVFVDGTPVGPVSYGQLRTDVATLFPGYNNATAAGGNRSLDTTRFTNGLHTIAWAVTDDAGAADGIGSRYFTVLNGSSGSSSSTSRTLATAPAEQRVSGDWGEPVTVQRGFDPRAPHEPVWPDVNGVRSIVVPPMERIEIRLADPSHQNVACAGRWSGHLLSRGAGARPLPIGTSLDSATGVFRWLPGVGFLGRFDLVFAHDHCGASHEIRVAMTLKSDN